MFAVQNQFGKKMCLLQRLQAEGSRSGVQIQEYQPKKRTCKVLYTNASKRWLFPERFEESKCGIRFR